MGDLCHVPPKPSPTLKDVTDEETGEGLKKPRPADSTKSRVPPAPPGSLTPCCLPLLKTIIYEQFPEVQLDLILSCVLATKGENGI